MFDKPTVYKINRVFFQIFIFVVLLFLVALVLWFRKHYSAIEKYMEYSYVGTCIESINMDNKVAVSKGIYIREQDELLTSYIQNNSYIQEKLLDWQHNLAKHNQMSPDQLSQNVAIDSVQDSTESGILAITYHYRFGSDGMEAKDSINYKTNKYELTKFEKSNQTVDWNLACRQAQKILHKKNVKLLPIAIKAKEGSAYLSSSTAWYDCTVNNHFSKNDVYTMAEINVENNQITQYKNNEKCARVMR